MMRQLPEDTCDEPLAPETYRHHQLLVKSAHCARPVVCDGKNAYISCLTMNRAGGAWDMTVYLAGDPTPRDSREITITTNNNDGE
jgi:hypothetical protein